MQISNNPRFDYYPVATEQQRRNPDRLPVVLEGEAEFKSVVSPQRADNTSVVLAADSNAQGQQARFIRDFMTTKRQADRQDVLPQSLPRAVQQYLTVAEIGDSNSSLPRLLDEIV